MKAKLWLRAEAAGLFGEAAVEVSCGCDAWETGALAANVGARCLVLGAV